MRSDEQRGIWFAAGCYILWGSIPLYFRLLAAVPAIDILAHRAIWSLAFLVFLLTVRREWQWLKPALHSPRTLSLYATAGVVLAVNWYTYIWAVNAGFVIESSLGYFINPLVSVLLGVVVLREQLRPGQWLAIAAAAAGVLFLTVTYGQLPWIALMLAFTFGFYGLLKKQGRLHSAQGLTVETGTVLLPALALLLYRELSGFDSLVQYGWGTTLLLVAAGAVTVLPLVWFASAARLIRLSLLGVLQYIAPTLQFLVGLLIFREPFSQTRLLGFAIIWLALGIYTAEGLWQQRHLRRVRPSLS